MDLKFKPHCPTKSADEGAGDCDSHSLDASMLWYDCSCLQRSHEKCVWAKSQKRPKFPVSNSERPKGLFASARNRSVAPAQSKRPNLGQQWQQLRWHTTSVRLLSIARQPPREEERHQWCFDLLLVLRSNLLLLSERETVFLAKAICLPFCAPNGKQSSSMPSSHAE